MFILIFAFALMFLVFQPAFVQAAWTPLIQASDFVGVTTDVQTVAAGIITVLLIVVGLGILVKVLSH